MAAKVLFTLSLLSFAVVTFAKETAAALPRVQLTRLYEQGASERIDLSCTPDKKGTQEFFCEMRRYRNGVEVAMTSLYAKQTRAILTGFFHAVPSENRKPPVTPERESAAKSDPMLVWDVRYEGTAIEGTLFRHQMGRKDAMVEAVLSLEGMLDSQFYR